MFACEHSPVEDDYTEESFPDEDSDRDQAWRLQQTIAASELLREARKWARKPYREVEWPAPNA